MSAPPVSHSAAAQDLVGGQPPWDSNSIPKCKDWLERPERTRSYAAVRLLRWETRHSQTRHSQAKRGEYVSLLHRKGTLQIPPTFHGLQHGHFVGVLQVRANGNPHADSRDAHAQRLQ